MRDLLLHNQHSEDESADEEDIYDTLARICESYDEPHGPVAFNIHDYKAAVEELSLRPHPHTFATLEAIAETKFVFDSSWVQALHLYLGSVAVEPTMQAALARWKLAAKKNVLARFGDASSRLALQMEKYYILEHKELVQNMQELAGRVLGNMQYFERLQKERIVTHMRKFDSSMVRKLRLRNAVCYLTSAEERSRTLEDSVRQVQLSSAVRALVLPTRTALFRRSCKARLLQHWYAAAQRYPQIEYTPVKPDFAAIKSLSQVLEQRTQELKLARKRHVLQEWFGLFKQTVLTGYWQLRQLKELLSLFRLSANAKLYLYYNIRADMQSTLALCRSKAARIEAGITAGAHVQRPTKQRALALLKESATSNERLVVLAEELRAKNRTRCAVEVVRAQLARIKELNAKAQSLLSLALVEQTQKSILRRRDEAMERQAAALVESNRQALILRIVQFMRSVARRMPPTNVVCAPLLAKMRALSLNNIRTANEQALKWAAFVLGEAVVAGLNQLTILEDQAEELLRSRPHTLGAYYLRSMSMAALRLSLRWSEVESTNTRKARLQWRRFFDQLYERQVPRTPRSVQIPRSVRRVRPASSPASSASSAPSTPRRILFRSAGRAID